MSDLISKSALIEALIKCKGLGRKSCELVAEAIKNQPEAYNVDKVVEQINETREIFESQHIVPCINMDRATEIVKRGGIDDGNSGN